MKRVFDVTAASMALLALLPAIAIVVTVIMVTQGRPILYRHRRLGRYATTFGCLKFRTMVKNADEVLAIHLAKDAAAHSEWHATRKLKNDPRITRFGKILRRSSLDEIPQLINIIRGDMSIVGPRPIVMAEVRFYGARIAEYYKVRPGLTGLWQISGRSDVSYARRVGLDYHYARSRSFAGDLKIIAKTVPVVLKADGTY